MPPQVFPDATFHDLGPLNPPLLTSPFPRTLPREMSLLTSIPRIARSYPNLCFNASVPTSRPTKVNVSTSVSGGAFPTGGNRLRSSGVSHLFLGKEKRERMEKWPRFAGASAVVSHHNLQWISAVSTIVLMLSKGTAIQKPFLAPLFALQAPGVVVSWIKGEHGAWIAFVALLVRLFYFIPGELDLPFITMLLVMAAPYQPLALRGGPSGSIISLAISGYLAYQHFSKVGSLRKAFEQGAIVATLAIVCVLVVSISFLF